MLWLTKSVDWNHLCVLQTNQRKKEDFTEKHDRNTQQSSAVWDETYHGKIFIHECEKSHTNKAIAFILYDS